MAGVILNHNVKVEVSKEAETLSKYDVKNVSDIRLDQSLSPTSTPKAGIASPNQDKGQTAISA